MVLKYTEDENVLLAYLEEGNEDDRVRAICYLKETKENYDRVWNVFLSDESEEVRGNALSKCLYIRPDKIWDILKYLVESNETVHVLDGHRFYSYHTNDKYIAQVAKKLHQLHEKEKEK